MGHSIVSPFFLLFYSSLYRISRNLSVKYPDPSIILLRESILIYLYCKIVKIYEKVYFDIKFWIDGRDMPQHALIHATGFSMDARKVHRLCFDPQHSGKEKHTF